MLNDRKTSELLSKSFHGELSADEEVELKKSVSESSDSQSFAKLSRLIQDSVADFANASASGDPSVGPGLSVAAKDRLRSSVREAKRLSAGGTVDVPVPLDLSKSSAAAAPGDHRESVARFTLLRKIGEGGLGTVWLARDEMLKRTVALKEMLPEKAESPKHLLRFQREATITGFLEHPNVVPLYMSGENPVTGKPFYAMRFVGKQTLADKIAEYHARVEVAQAESIDLHRLLGVFLDICQAIAYSHSRGVVHRDLKPENVALDNFGQVIVLDWGIAKLVSDGELAIQSSLNPCTADDCSLTNTMAGEVVGTPLYMAPEQAAGDLDSVDQRTDVYGLGAILFAILTGLAPHEKTGHELQGSQVSELLTAIKDRDAPLPRELNPNVPRDLEAICVRALSRLRYSRHTSAQELAEDVERWMAGQQEKQQMYGTMRMEGRDLRTKLASCIRGFGTNVRFMSTLPPIQGLIDSASGIDKEGETIWRERLVTIFRGLLRSNSDFSAVTYSRVQDGQVSELCRVERPSLELEARSVPRSRLATGPLSEFGQTVMRKMPDDVHVAIHRCETPEDCLAQLKLEAGVPVFDSEEEPFGMVVIEGDFLRLATDQLQAQSRTSDKVLVIDASGHIILEEGGVPLGTCRIAEAIEHWPRVRESLSLHHDYVDSGCHLFATQVELVPRISSFTLALLAKS